MSKGVEGAAVEKPRLQAGGYYFSSPLSIVARQNRHASQAKKETAAHVRTTFLSRFKLITATVLFFGTVSRQINRSHAVHS